MARNSENIAGAISAVNNIVSAQTEALAQIKTSLASKTAGAIDISLGLTGTAVGDIVKVKAVDASGKPTEWEAAELGETWELISEGTVSEEVGAISITQDTNGNAFSLSKANLFIQTASTETNTAENNAQVRVNRNSAQTVILTNIPRVFRVNSNGYFIATILVENRSFLSFAATSAGTTWLLQNFELTSNASQENDFLPINGLCIIPQPGKTSVFGVGSKWRLEGVRI